jgi:Secretion system C-terminal sorting domain
VLDNNAFVFATHFNDDIKLQQIGNCAPVIISSQISLLNNHHIKLFPNPVFNNRINLELESKNKSLSLFIYDMHGNLKLFHQYKNTQSVTIDLSNFTEGNYLFRVLADNEVYSSVVCKN